MNIKPLGDKLVVEPDKPKEKSEGGLFIPEKAQEKQTIGTILAVGPNVEEIKVGDRIVFPKYEGVQLTLEGKAVTMLHEKNVMAKFEEVTYV